MSSRLVLPQRIHSADRMCGRNVCKSPRRSRSVRIVSRRILLRWEYDIADELSCRLLLSVWNGKTASTVSDRNMEQSYNAVGRESVRNVCIWNVLLDVGIESNDRVLRCGIYVLVRVHDAVRKECVCQRNGMSKRPFLSVRNRTSASVSDGNVCEHNQTRNGNTMHTLRRRRVLCNYRIDTCPRKL